jgi:ADP-ribose pyrophosphatase YjhB (NUDIX family)
MNTQPKADIQLTSNVVIASPNGQVLLTQYDEDDDRLWIPGASINEYEHPDAAAIRALADVGLATNHAVKLSHIESFRGRRGWHVMFNYIVALDSEQAASQAKWFDPKNLPPTAHGDWESGVITKALTEELKLRPV